MKLWHKIGLGLLGLIFSTPFGYLSLMGGIFGGIISSIIATIICALYCYYVLKLDIKSVSIISGLFFFIFIPISYIIFPRLIYPIFSKLF